MKSPITSSFILILKVLFSVICMLLFFLQLYLFLYSSEVMLGDFYHGIGGYLLILHSSLASLSRIIFYIILFSYMYLYIHPYYNIVISSVIQILIYVLSLSGLFFNLLFLLTGFIWGDYSWGSFYTIEYRFIQLVLNILLYIIIILQYIIEKYTNYIRIALYLLLTLYTIMLVIDKFRLFLPEYIPNLYNNLHQNEETLHIFLVSVSGSYLYYISLSILYYLFCILYYIIYVYNLYVINYIRIP